MCRLLPLMLLAAAVHGSDCRRVSTGFPALNDPFLLPYRGMPGGLYPDGLNHRPAAHEQAGLKLAAEVKPRSSTGEVDERGGKTVLLSVGMSNTTQEFSAFQALAAGSADLHPQLVLVDGAQGGWSSERMVEDPETYWSGVTARLRAAGVTAAQVQAAWVKLASATPRLPFPEDAWKLETEAEKILGQLRARFPNLKVAYLSSRAYGGYASTTLNPEPYAYQAGHAVKWLIQRQILGEAEVSFETGKLPWLSWGPYLWADGTSVRYDGLSWGCADFTDDGTHPSEAGRAKVARMLLDFFKGDSTTRPWFVRPAGAVAAPVVSGIVNAASQAAALTWGTVALIQGKGLAGASLAADTLPLPYSLGGVRVEVGGDAAPLYSVSPEAILFALPPAAPSLEVVVVRETARSNATLIRPDLYAPGIFTQDGKPEGLVAARHLGGQAVTAANPSHGGEVIEVYATGTGVMHPMMRRPEIIPVVTVGGVEAGLIFWGSAPAWPGMHQFNVVIPKGLQAGTPLAVELRYGEARSNRPVLPVSP